MTLLTTTTFEDQLSDGLIWGKSIVFSNNPKHHYNVKLPTEYDPSIHSLGEGEDEDSAYQPHFIVNYSQLYRTFVVDNVTSRKSFAKELIPPHLIQTGDVLQTSEYRGVGSYYAVWLHGGLFENPSSLNDVKLRKAARVGEEESEEEGGKKGEQEEAESVLGNVDQDTLSQLQKVVSKWDHSEFELRYLLEGGYPDLLVKLLDAKQKDSLLAQIRSYKVFGDPGHVGYRAATRGQPDWDSFAPDEIFYGDDGDARTQNPEQFFESLPEVSYPLLKQRKLLSNALRHRPWLELYLFEHLDEMGYAAPTAVSIAPIGYFSGEYNERWIDLELLPSPLDRETAYGYVLHNIRERFPENAGEEKEDNEEEELEEEEEDETGDHKKKSFAIKPIKPLLDLAVTDFEG